MRPNLIKAYKKLSSEKGQIDGCFLLLMGYARSSFRDVESFLRIVLGLEENVIELILKPYTSDFIIYELPPIIYSIKDISEVVYTMGNHEGTLQTKLLLTCFG